MKDQRNQKATPSNADLGFRVPPQAVEVEKHVIGAIMLGDLMDLDTAAGVLQPEDFYLEKHQTLFRAMQNLAAARTPPDMLTLREELRRTGGLGEVTESYLIEISSEVVSSANIRQHAEIVKDKATLRAVISTATRILEQAYAGETSGREVVRDAEDSVYRLGEVARGAMEGLVSMSGCLIRTAKQLDDMAAGRPNRVRMGIPAIDDISHGLRFGSLNLLAARPGIGKSALALQAAVSCGKPVPLFSLEMLIEEEVERMMAQLDPSLNGDGLSTQAMVLSKRAAIEAAYKTLSKYPIEICDSSKVTPSFILAECRRMKRRHGELGLILVDYLQMVRAMGKHSRRDLEIGSVSADLKDVGMELATPVLAVASLSRKCEERDNKRPIESDLRDAGQLESDAHQIIFLYRHSKYSQAAKKDAKIKNITEFNIAKNRGGVTGRGLLDFHGARSWFYQVSDQDRAYYSNFLKGADFLGEDGQTGAKAAPKGPKKPKAGGTGSWHDGDGIGSQTIV